MAHCPTCKKAYPDDVAECPMDHVALVDELPYQTREGEDGTTWVEIASVGSDDESRLLAGFLDAEGIPAQIENVKFTMEPINFGTMGDIRIYVSSEDEERAIELLRARNVAFDKLADDDETLVTDEGTAVVGENAETEKD
ncbi:MAG: hypothetical protein ABI837_11180 [Acidobacteriota bacterium]